MIDATFAEYEMQLDRLIDEIGVLTAEIGQLRRRNEDLEQQLSRAAIAERIVMSDHRVDL